MATETKAVTATTVLGPGWSKFEAQCLASDFGKGPARVLLPEWFDSIRRTAHQIEADDDCTEGQVNSLDDLLNGPDNWQDLTEGIGLAFDLKWAAWQAVATLVCRWAADTGLCDYQTCI
jgi:hypothetical protein